MYFCYFIIIFPWQWKWTFIWTNSNPLYPRMLVPIASLVEIGPFFVKKIFKFYQCIFAISSLSPFGKEWPFVWRNLNPLHPRMLCAMFGWNWLSGFWRRRWNCVKFTDRLTTDDQKSSLEKIFDPHQSNKKNIYIWSAHTFASQKSNNDPLSDPVAEKEKINRSQKLFLRIVNEI